LLERSGPEGGQGRVPPRSGKGEERVLVLLREIFLIKLTPRDEKIAEQGMREKDAVITM